MEPFSFLNSRLNLVILTIFSVVFIFILIINPDPLVSWIFSGTILAYGLVSGFFFFRSGQKGENFTGENEPKKSSDSLTGLFNRRYFENRLEQELEKAEREKNNFSLVYFDVDKFKHWNENLSASGREDLVKKIGEFLLENSGEDVIISRFWGDRFALLIPRGLGSSEDEVKALLEKLRNYPFRIGETDITLQASCGIALYPGDGKTREKLQKEAINFLQHSKNLGGGIISSRKNAFPLDFRESISIYPEGVFLDKIAKTSTQLFLLYKDRNIEIIRQHIVAGKPFSVDSEGSRSGFEFFFILSGEVKSIEREKIFKSGSYIKTGPIQGRSFFETITPVDILYITSNSIFEEKSTQLAYWKKMVDSVKEKDQRIEGHGRRIETLAKKIGQAMGLEGQDLFSLIYASFLHDIGKTKIPGEILQKKGPLNEKEWEIVKKHPQWGKEIIEENLKNIYTEEDVAEIVYQHHENYDGTGYPSGLKGEEIRIEAQILSLLDAFDAMTSERPYQSAKTIPEALEEIKRCSGSQFSPEVVKHFLRLMEKEEVEE